jgi:hypothetical protein
MSLELPPPDDLKPIVQDDHSTSSKILAGIAANHPRDRISIQDIIDALGERSFGFLLLMFALPCIVAPPGLSSLPAIPLFFFGAQMLFRYDRAWLPVAIARREFAKKDIEFVVRNTVPIMRRIEKWCKPRMAIFIGPIGERLLGLLVILLASIIILPGPGTNGPPGVAIAFLAIAMIEKDGLLVFLGVVGSFVAMYLAITGLLLFFQWIVPAVLGWFGVAF